MVVNKFLSRVKSQVYRRTALRSKEDEEEKIVFKYYIDSPRKRIIPTKKLLVRGWIIPEGRARIKAVRAKNNSQYHVIEYGVERADVVRAFSKLSPAKTRKCGFFGSFTFQDGEVTIEVDFGDGFEEIASQEVRHSPERLFEVLYNPALSTNLAEHQNLIDNKRKYYYQPEHPKNFKRAANDSRLVAFYLPQYHPIPENDETWGKGFTEWANVASGQPRFVGHEQPLLPADLGFYDLRLEENLANQIQLAKKYGLYGFCFYYYWFSGKKLLGKPLENFLKRKDWNFNFMICWANENWTKRWDGRNDDIIIAQKYLASDPLNFIKDVEHILLDPRYIRQNGKPLLAVYRGSALDNPEKYTKAWRKYFKTKHGLELEITTMLNFDHRSPLKYGFDSGVEFTPQTDQRLLDADTRRSRLQRLKGQLLDETFDGAVVDYRHFALADRSHKRFNFPAYKCVSPAWDNEARKKGSRSFTLFGANPDLYGHWLDKALTAARQDNESPLVFINAWNEWAEGTTLEPTVHLGHGFLTATAQVMAIHSRQTKNQTNFPRFGLKKRSNAEVAVVVHLYYPKEWNYIRTRLNTLKNTTYDLYLTVTEKDRSLIPKIKKELPGAQVILVPNRGRDVLPFLAIAGRLEKMGYKYLLKLHTKKSNHRRDGRKWFEDVVDNLLPSSRLVGRLLTTLRTDAALIGPAGHFVSLDFYLGSNEQKINQLLAKIYDRKTAKAVLRQPDSFGFFAGTMFWCRLESIKQLLDLHLIPEDFESEKGQLDGTTAHSVERVLTLLPLVNQQPVYQSSKAGLKKITASRSKVQYKYADKK